MNLTGTTRDDVRACVVCSTRTLEWVRGWDDRIRCAAHAPDGPRPFDRSLSEYLLEGDQGHIKVVHEPCGAHLLTTLRVHADTIARIAREHTCTGLEESA